MTEQQINQIVGSEPHLRHLCGDGAEMLRYNSCFAAAYRELCAAYEADGYTLYCVDPLQSGFLSQSATYVKGDAYAVLFFCPWEYQLHVTTSEAGTKVEELI